VIAPTKKPESDTSDNLARPIGGRQAFRVTTRLFLPGAQPPGTFPHTVTDESVALRALQVAGQRILIREEAHEVALGVDDHHVVLIPEGILVRP
jgi:hypothetical protein